MSSTLDLTALVTEFRTTAAQHRATAEAESAAVYRDVYLGLATVLDGLADDLEAVG